MPEVVSTDHLTLPDGQGSLRARIAMALRAAIRSGTLAPGTVYSAPALASRFGVSATPVREAMLDMVNDGLAEPVPNRGFRVIDVSPTELRHVAEVRLRLEPVAISDLAGRLTALEIEGLRAKVDSIAEAAGEDDGAGAAQAAWVFRDVLLSLCPNPVLVETISWLRDRSRPFAIPSIDYTKFARTQYELIDSLANGDADKVRRTIEFDIERFSPSSRVASQA